MRLAIVLAFIPIVATAAAPSLPDRYRDMTLIVTDAATVDDGAVVADRLAKALAPAGQLFFPPNVIVMRVPATQMPVVLAERCVVAVTKTPPSDAIAALARAPHARDGVSFVRAVHEGTLAIPPYSGPPRPLLEEVRSPASRPRPASASAGRTRTPGKVASAVNDVFSGRTAINVFWVESNGAIDPNEFTWPASLHAIQANRFSDSLWWWTYVAQNQGVSLTFSVAYRSVHSGNYEVLQPYEPIWHKSGQQYLWTDAIMSNLGYTTGDERDRIAAFNAASRAQLLADKAFCVFMIYNPPEEGAPSTFDDRRAAIANMGGPSFSILYRNGGWTPAEFPMVAAHEIGHQFWACDEYDSGFGCGAVCGVCAPDGPRPHLVNHNCGACQNPPLTCLMRDTGAAYSGGVLCTHTKQQIGW